MASQYVVEDRTTASNLAIKINDGQLFFEATVDANSAEPIVEDDTNAGTYWKIFIDDGQLGFESTVTAQDDAVDLDDPTGLVTWRLGVNDGQFYYFQTTFAFRRLLAVKSEDGSYRVALSSVSGYAVKSVESSYVVKSDMRS